MKLNKILVVVGLIMVFGGFIFTLLPHDVHYLITGAVTFGHHDHSAYSHDEHKTWGYIFSLIGVSLAVIGWKFR